jgi:hypothetical protein
VVSSRQVPLAILKKKIEAENDPIKKKNLKFKLHRMKKVRVKIYKKQLFLILR